MEQEVKKAIMLLKSLIFHYHGLDEDEIKLLKAAARRLHAEDELDWANQFIAEDYMSAFDRSREYLSKTIGKADEKTRLHELNEVWEDNHKKGYVTEMEATAMINLAKDWHVEKQFIKLINH